MFQKNIKLLITIFLGIPEFWKYPNIFDVSRDTA